jgi:hypothetical protein
MSTSYEDDTIATVIRSGHGVCSGVLGNIMGMGLQTIGEPFRICLGTLSGALSETYPISGWLLDNLQLGLW